MVTIKEMLGWLCGASIAVVWISYALLGPGNMIFLAVAIALTILLGTLSGGLIALSQDKADYKDVIGWLCGATIGAVWASFAIAGVLSNMIFLVVAITLTIILGTLSGGLLGLTKKAK